MSQNNDIIVRRKLLCADITGVEKSYFLYSDGGTNFRSNDTITIVDVKLSMIALRKKVSLQF